MRRIPKLIGYNVVVSFFILLITLTFAIQIPLAYAGGKSPYESGYDHGCDDADLSPSDRYINEPGKGPSFHTDEFMSGYYDGFQECGGDGSSGDGDRDSDGDGDGNGGRSLEGDIRNWCVRNLPLSEERCDSLIRAGKAYVICNLLRLAGFPLC